MSKYTTEERLTAYHEAGHAVMRYLLKDSVNAVWAKPLHEKNNTCIGLTVSVHHHEFLKIQGDCEELRRNQLACVAGRISEQIFFPKEWRQSDGSASDWEKLREELNHEGYGNEQIQNICISAKKILSKKENKKLVRKFAWVLLHNNQHLDYLEIGIIFGYISGKRILKRKLIQYRSRLKKWWNKR